MSYDVFLLHEFIDTATAITQHGHQAEDLAYNNLTYLRHLVYGHYNSGMCVRCVFRSQHELSVYSNIVYISQATTTDGSCLFTTYRDTTLLMLGSVFLLLLLCICVSGHLFSRPALL